MPGTTYNFTTGQTFLPDIGKLAYNDCVFSPFYATEISANAIKDEANRTVKYTEITLTADGYVTLGNTFPTTAGSNIAPTMANLHLLLTAQGGTLTYKGRGFDLTINSAGGATVKVGDIVVGNANMDVAWGPVPELIEFQPLGGGLSAKVKWKVITRICPIPPGKGFFGAPMLQFNSETSVSYGEDRFSSISVRGTLEVPITRTPLQGTRTLTFTADNFRGAISTAVFKGIDLSRFRITHSEFPVSRDKRTLTWDVSAEEKPYMDLPPNCSIARGSFNFRPAKTGPGLALWFCTLQATYTLRNNVSRRQAYELFLALLRLRMSESVNCHIADPDDNADEQQGGKPQIQNPITTAFKFFLFPQGTAGDVLFAPDPKNEKEVKNSKKTILLNFEGNEGIYLDSKTVSFSAMWRICTTFSHILVASGMWSKINEKNDKGGNLWATSMQNVEGVNSWLTNRLDPKLDIIVDFGTQEIVPPGPGPGVAAG